MFGNETNATPEVRERRPRLDLLSAPVLGRFLAWRRSRIAVQGVFLLGALALVLRGLLGPRIAPKNLATLVTWVHYRGLLVFALLAVGNVFCFGCPFLLPRELARRLRRPARRLPRVERARSGVSGRRFVTAPEGASARHGATSTGRSNTGTRCLPTFGSSDTSTSPLGQGYRICCKTWLSS